LASGGQPDGQQDKSPSANPANPARARQRTMGLPQIEMATGKDHFTNVPAACGGENQVDRLPSEYTGRVNRNALASVRTDYQQNRGLSPAG
jgi:hypothetical protein